jgi:lactoylglutathione lyase
MRVDHIALWTHDLDRCKRFFCRDATEGAAYVNAKKGFESCFLTFADGPGRNARDSRTWTCRSARSGSLMSLSNGSERMATRFLTVRAEPGDGYYESMVLDPDGNRIEITA